MVTHFLDLADLQGSELRDLLDAALARKATRAGQPKGAVDADAPLAGHVLAMIFEKPSTRTRLSFDLGMRQLGGQTMVLNQSDMQLGRGESIADTAAVISRFADIAMLRTGPHETLSELASNASIPVINGLTNLSHPCQIMADLQTIQAHLGALEHQIVAWFGDGNNVANSWIEAAALFGFELRIAGPEAYRPPAHLVAWARAEGANISFVDKAEIAAKDATVLVTDVWISMGDDEGNRLQDMAPFQVTETLMSLAAPDAIFMHCLPALRGQEVTAEVIDGVQSVVFDEAENRLHAQKAIMAHIFDDNF